MGFDRRTLGLLVLLAVIGLPAFTLRLFCVGHSCDAPAEATSAIPFCSLPDRTRSLVAAGFREGRSPELLGVTSETPVAGGHAFGRRDPAPQWPSTQAIPRRVPLVFTGAGLAAIALPSGVGLDDVAPTIAALMGIERGHPEVRSGAAIPGLESSGPAPLVVQIVWKGVGSAELEAAPAEWPVLRSIEEQGSSTSDAEVPFLPLDPAAVLTTIGTGGLPSQHGITGTLIRNDEGRLVEAWGPDAPVSVIAALGDDLDNLTRQRARVGLVASDPADRGLIGDDWYVTSDRDDMLVVPGGPGRAVADLLADGYGQDEIPDLLGVTLRGSLGAMDRTTGRIIELVEDRVPGAVSVVTASGSSANAADLEGREVGRRVDSLLSARLVEATVPGGLFLDQEVIAAEEIPEDRILEAMSRVTDTAGSRVFEDVFPAITVSFGRYC
ncbi:MAG TPA: hypothetical protein VJ927_02790 [Actinomycetota bacterium]|nr:hypothetical protein [Actinomycetota bacterium]